MEQIYENKGAVEQIKTEHQDFWTIEKITLDDGIKQWIKGASFPSRGLTTPEAMFACNQVKRLFIKGLQLFSWRLLLVNRKKLLETFNDIAWKVMNPHILKYEYMTPVAQEIQDIIYDLLIGEDIEANVALQFAKIFSHLIEYDNAYRLRVEDIMNETSKEKLIKNPRKEIKRLMKILVERDHPGVADKFLKIGRLVRLVLLLPRVKRLFVREIGDSSFEKLQPDDIDKYWMCFRTDYRFGGKSSEDRKVERDNRGWIIPKSEKLC